MDWKHLSQYKNAAICTSFLLLETLNCHVVNMRVNIHDVIHYKTVNDLETYHHDATKSL